MHVYISPANHSERYITWDAYLQQCTQFRSGYKHVINGAVNI